ncbi:MAG: hypothetical protein OEO79_14765 [Gemmatimonadota bacterium]|nr:hypothetical protein [Gemmatimonadota bacterium]
MINRKVYSELSLVVHEVVGELSADDFREAGVALYELDPVPPFSLWDLTHASVAEYDIDKIRRLQHEVAGIAKGREGGRTAVVAPTDLTFGIVRQYLALIESAQLPFEHNVFRTKAEAVSWLGLEMDSLGPPPAG